MKKHLTILILLLFTLTGCNGRRELKEIENLLENDIEAAADMADSYNPYRKKQRAALCYYAKGMVNMASDNIAIATDNLTKALYLFTDTTCRNYALTQHNLGVLLLENGLYETAADYIRNSTANFSRLGEQESVSFNNYLLALSYLYRNGYSQAENLFDSLLNDSCLELPIRNECNLHLAKISFYRDSNVDGALLLADRYINNCTDGQPASGYSLKGQIFYSIFENDSALASLSTSVSMAGNNLKTLRVDYKCLRDLAVRMKNYNAAVGFSKEYEAINDSIYKRSLKEEITKKKLEYSNELAQYRISTVRKVLLIIVLAVALLLAISTVTWITRARLQRKSFYITQNDNFIISRNQQNETGSLKQDMADASSQFRSTVSYQIVLEKQGQENGFTSSEREMIIHDLFLYFSNPIRIIKEECEKVNRNELVFLCCAAVGLGSDTVSDLLCTSVSNVRSIKSRLKAKLNATLLQRDLSAVLA